MIFFILVLTIFCGAILKENLVTLYSLDGRQEQVLECNVEKQLQVGWYLEPVTLLYALDGRTEIVPTSIVEAQLQVGWYLEPVQKLYSADGREIIVEKVKVKDYLLVGWYEEDVRAKAIARITASDVADLANVMHSEANGLDTREVAMVAWCVLNRVDDNQGTIHSICNSNQFTRRGNKTAYAWLAEDVLIRWYLEKQGVPEVGRVLPRDYFWFYGDGRHNYFRNNFNGKGELYSLFEKYINPYN